MMLKKANGYSKNIRLYKEDFDPESWCFLSEILDFPVEAEMLDFSMNGFLHLPRVFEDNEDVFIPVDEKAILHR